MARWERLLDEGVYPTKAAFAHAEGVSRAAVTKALAKLAASTTHAQEKRRSPELHPSVRWMSP